MMQFWGYKRKEGRAGIRNHVLILPTCACGSESCRVVASQVRGAVNIVFNTGCSDVAANTEMSQKVLTGFACNPERLRSVHHWSGVRNCPPPKTSGEDSKYDQQAGGVLRHPGRGRHAENH